MAIGFVRGGGGCVVAMAAALDVAVDSDLYDFRFGQIWWWCCSRVWRRLVLMWWFFGGGGKEESASFWPFCVYNILLVFSFATSELFQQPCIAFSFSMSVH
ncbi:hypothetical protein QQ045_027028 [Rhodiola kirilowii]